MNVRSINPSTDHNRSYVALCWRQPWQGIPSINLRRARPMTDQPLEIWIAMDETGSWEIAKDEHDAFEALDKNSGGLARRLVVRAVAIGCWRSLTA